MSPNTFKTELIYYACQPLTFPTHFPYHPSSSSPPYFQHSKQSTTMELLFRRTSNLNKKTKTIIIILPITLILVTVIRLNYPFPKYPAPLSKNPAHLAARYHADDIKITDDQEHCDVFTGEWVPNPDAPYYTNRTCWAIHEHQNCMKYGRPDTDFLKWKWKPDGCEMQVLNPFQFLDIVRGKSLAFVGDSVGRNQMQSMICLLSRVCTSFSFRIQFCLSLQLILFRPVSYYSVSVNSIRFRLIFPVQLLFRICSRVSLPEGVRLNLKMSFGAFQVSLLAFYWDAKLTFGILLINCY